MSTRLIFELNSEGRVGYRFPELDVPSPDVDDLIDGNVRREAPASLPQVAEIDVIRHYTELASKSFGVDAGFYPLGSCTMKYNPKINEDVAAFGGFANIHPFQSEDTVQGMLELIHKQQRASVR